MPTSILILQGHPDPAGNRLCHALAGAYAEGARAAGHHVEQLAIADLDVPPLQSKQDFEHGDLPESLNAARDKLLAADHLVIIFPLWLGMPPALLKGFLEQIMRPGVAFEYQERGLPKKKMKGRSARLIVTMGMPAFLYRLFYRAHGVKALKRNVLSFVGYSPVRDTMFGMVEGGSEAKYEKWFGKMKRLGAKAA